MPAYQQYRTTALKTILWLGFITGSLDAIAAMLLSPDTPPDIIFKFIASGYFGQAAFNGGLEMVIAGVLFHYLIAYLFTLFFYLVYPFGDNIAKNKYVVAIVYGGIAWIIMNKLVIPFTPIGAHPVSPLNVIKGLAALIICIGLPIVIVADKSFKNG